MTAQRPSEFRFGIDLTPDYLIGLNERARPNRVSQPRGGQSPGGRVVNRAGQGQEVFDLRAFVDGDDVRYLDHRATARKGSAYVKRFHEERNSKLILVLDFRPSMYFGIRRALYAFSAAELLVLAGWRHIRSQGQVGLYAFTSFKEVFVPPRPRDHAMLKAIAQITELYDVGMRETQDGAPSVALDERLSQLPRLVERGSTVLVASSFDEPGKSIGNTFNRLRHRNHLRCLCLANTELEDLPKGRYPVFDRKLARSTEVSSFESFSAPDFINLAEGDLVLDASADPTAHLGALVA